MVLIPLKNSSKNNHSNLYVKGRLDVLVALFLLDKLHEANLLLCFKIYKVVHL